MASLTAKWGVHTPLSKAQFEEYGQAGIGALHAQLLVNRGITGAEAMQRFLAARYEDLPDPLALIDMERALERIQRAFADGEHITVYGDFDADGVTSAALLTRALRALKQPAAPLDYFIPHRIEDARGVSKEAIDKLKQWGTRLLITTDCGSSDVAEIEYAKTLGIDVIITDHHHPPEPRPQPYAMINPWREDAPDSERDLCGAGIAFKLAQALFRASGREAEARDLLDLVAIGTIGDVAQLLGENHTLARLGLDQLNRTTNAGLKALIQIVKTQQGPLRERDISYALGPRINAAGRMKHASIAFELLTTGDEAEAQARARELEELNQARQQITEELMKLVREQAKEQIANPVVLVYGEKSAWPEGIIGLVAGKLSEEIKRTVFVLSQDDLTSRGSARSHGDFNIIEALRNRADLFERHGGHAQAAGFTILNSNIEALREHLLGWQGNSTPSNGLTVEVEVVEVPDVATVAVVTEQETSQPSTTHMVDIVISRPDKQLTYDAYTRIGLLSPFGAGNPEPVFRLDGARLVRRWASGPEGRHLRARLRYNDSNLDGTYLRGGSLLDTYAEGALVNVIFCLEPSRNKFDAEGKQEVWLKILYMDVVE
ncbi:MAG TPA: single-stranded-DNA-specific exonuclease RecJ [Ktedonobacteraceae bacterium]|nr:single-stranded-DNA-specific exonuclease RecJ [Ktedonobacteraceae bacterium]